QVPECDLDGRHRHRPEALLAEVADRPQYRCPGGLRRERVGALHLLRKLRANEVGDRVGPVGVAKAGLAAAVRADDYAGERVPLERAIGLGLLERDRVGGDLQALDRDLDAGPGGDGHQRVTNSLSLPLNDWRMIRPAFGSPLISAFARPVAWSIMMCGGSGGTSGSVIAS